MKKRILIYILFCVFFSSNLYALTSFQLHNIDKAHAMGFTGAGVNMAVADTEFYTTHSALSGKFIDVFNNTTTTGVSHGTSVSSIMGANHTDGKYYGVAYGAQMVGSADYGNYIAYTGDKGLNYLLNNDVSIINNSWAYKNYNTYNGVYLPHSSISKILIVFANGNDGSLSPTQPAIAPKYNESLGAWLTVGNINANNITRKDDGSLKVDARAVSTNNGQLCVGAERFCVMASGTSVTAANSQGGYAPCTGTSCAAPLVSGVAALVKQKFPFLDGKQLADVILSTANSDFEAPKVTIKNQTLIYIGSAVPTDETQIANDVKDAYGYSRPYSNVIKLSKEEVFGQGIVDAEKALGGLAEIDINRLTDNDKQNLHNESDTAFYTLDTKGYDAQFNNDISEKKWDDKYHEASATKKPTSFTSTTKAGFIKTGFGTLSLSGNLNYEGATIVKQGGLNFNANETQNIAGSLYIEDKASVNVNSTTLNIGSNLENQNGTITLNQSLLNTASYTQTGENARLIINFTPQIAQNLASQESVNLAQISAENQSKTTPNTQNAIFSATNFDIQSGEIIYEPQISAVSRNPQTINVLSTGTSDISDKITLASSNSLNFTLTNNGHSISIVAKDDAYANFDGANVDLANTLIDMSQAQLGADYEQFFANLNGTKISKTEYENTLKNLDNSAYLSHTEQILQAQNEMILENFITQNSNFSITPKYRQISLGGAYAGNSNFMGADIKVAKNTNGVGFGGFLNAGLLKSDFENGTKMDTKLVQMGLGASSDFGLIGAFGVGVAFNDLKRENSISADYKNYFASAQIGLRKDFSFAKTRLTPLIYATYDYVFGENFSENDGFFAKNYDAFSYSGVSASAGAVINQGLGEYFDLKIFAFYQHKITNNNFSQKAEFIDFAGHKFSQNYTLLKSLTRVGANLSFLSENTSFGLGVSGAFGSDYTNLGGILSFIYKFNGENLSKNSSQNPKNAIKKPSQNPNKNATKKINLNKQNLFNKPKQKIQSKQLKHQSSVKFVR